LRLAWILRLIGNPVGVGIADDEAISFDIDLLVGCSCGPHRWQCQLPLGRCRLVSSCFFQLIRERFEKQPQGLSVS